MAAKKPKKGVAGKNTGAATRNALKGKRSYTDKQVGRKVNRSGSTLSQIRTGSIRNPPANLAGNIRKAKPTGMKKKRSAR